MNLVYITSDHLRIWQFINKILIITNAHVGFEVLTAVRTNFTVVRNGTPLS